MLTLTLVRHASTALNEQRRYQGRTDPPLSERGRAEAAALRARLEGERFDAVVRSDALRCAETAELILPGVAVLPDPRLREMDFGAWDGMTYEQCLARDAALLEDWIADPTRTCPPGGEPFAVFARRVDQLVDGLPRQGSGLLVAHGGPIRRIVARALGLEWRHAVLMQLSPCGITRLALHPEGGHLLTLNDTAHLER
jgi:broad specificity phosphatase PhoE